MNTTKVHRTVAELPNGRWLIREWGRYYKSAVGAQKAIKREARMVAKAKGQLGADWVFIQIVVWEPVTKTGWKVIRAIAE